MLELNKIYNMDCIEGMKLIDDNFIDLIITDPPYNILKNDNINIGDKKIIRNIDFDQDIFNIEKFLDNINKILKDGGSYYIFCSDRQIGKYIEYSEKIGLRHSNTLVWYHRGGFPNIRKRAFSNHIQYIMFGHKEINNKYVFNFKSEIEMRNLLQFEGAVSFEYNEGNPGEYVGHPTQKPTKLFKHLIEISSHKDNIILDPFIGSGTTAISTLQTNRQFIGFEINKEYYDMANNRIKNWKSQMRF